MIRLVLALLALLAITVHAATDLCIESVKNNVITYRRLEPSAHSNNNESIIEKRLFSLQEEQDMARQVLGVFIELTVMSPNATDEDEQFKYYAARSSLLLILDSKAFDSLTFGVLSYGERTLTVSITLLTTKSCPNDKYTDDNTVSDIPISVILESILAPFDHPYIKLITQLEQESALSAIRSTGILIFMSLTILSMLTVFLVLPAYVKFLTTVQMRKYRQDNHTESSVRLSVNEHMLLIGVYFVSMCYAIVYCGYWIVEMTNYVLTDDALSTQIRQLLVPPFLINFMFIVLMSITSMTMTLLFALKNKYPFKLKPLYKIFVYVGTACMVMLLTCTSYHGFFLIIAIAIDYTTAINGILYFITLILAIYCSVPIILKQFYFTRKTKDCKNFLFTIVVLMFVITSFCILMDELSISNNNNYTSDLPQLAATTVLSFITLTMICAIGVIVEQSNSKTKTTAALKTDNVDNMEDPAEQHKAKEQGVNDSVVKHKPFKFGSGTERSVPRLIFIMCSNPGTVLAIIQHTIQQTIP